MKRYRIVSLILSLVLSVTLLTPAGTASGAEQAPLRSAVVHFDGTAQADELLQALSTLPDTRVLHRYNALLSGTAVETSEAGLQLIRQLPGVSGADFSTEHARPQAIADPLTDSNSLDLMSAADLSYTGDGMVIAVIDAGLRATHQAFAENDLMRSPAISREDVDAFVEQGGTNGRYLSERIPFAYDYCEEDQDISTADSHGTHVSALAVGYAQNSAGEVVFRGAAPAAQLLSMKVFPDRTSAGASDADILRALEDAWLLGADVICLSLGVDGGFTTGTAVSRMYTEAFQKLRQSGVVVCCAVGNSAATVTSKPDGTALPTTAYTDYGTAASPASYADTTAVAAANAPFIQSSGYIQAGERQLDYTRSISESGQTLPGLEKLADRTLTVAAVDGVGTAADFAAVNVRGKVALVRRGQITFAEKANNAAKAGAVACLFINNTVEEINPVADGATIPSALLSQADGTYLLEQLASGDQTIRISTGDYLQELSAEPEMLLPSSWGTTFDLRIAPTLTAPGGGILSASAAGDELYEQLSGTSMAAPNAAGAYALVLEKLYTSGMTKSAETAAIAESLLTGTARLMRTEEGIPLSPRQQGAGLIDLKAALNTDLVISEPLLELGENASGRFTLSFRVQNRSDRDMELTVTPTVLTDDWAVVDGTLRSLLSPRDLTDRVTVTGPDTLTLPAGGERTLTLQLTIPADLRQELGQVFTNGFFVEGYISLADQTGGQAHATFLGYCGDWEQAPIVEQTDFRSVLDAEAAGTTLPETDLGLSMVYLSGDGSLLLGQNPHLDTAALDSRFAISTFENEAHFSKGTLFAAKLTTLRNAQRLIMVISDRRSGRIYYVADLEQVHHSALSSLTGEMESAAVFQWSGVTVDGAALPDGTEVIVEFYGWTESDTAMTDTHARSASSPLQPESYRWLTSGSYDRALEWSFPLTIDRTAPTATAALSAEGDALTVSVKDTQFLAYAALSDSAGNVLAETACSGDKANQSHELTLDLSGYDTVPETLYVTASDYAANTVGYAIDLTDTSVTDCAMCLLEDVKMDAWYHEAVDLVWQADLMKNEDSLTFQPDRGATRADVIRALYQAAGAPEVNIVLPFSDVNSGAAYYNALQWAYDEGIATGYSDTTFAAFAFVSRQQLAAMLYRYAASAGDLTAADTSVLAAFSDAGDVDDWATEAMAWAVSEGLLSGREDGVLSPDATATRAELAQILVRLLELK